ncbi:MAG: sporulation protein YunB [Clostridia bacterium]|nr:sporulation protein YunB [Clostridia bacterium]
MVASQEEKRPKGRAVRLFLIAFLLLIALSLVLEENLSQVILDLAQADAYALAVDVLNEAVAGAMATGITYGELVALEKDTAGRVTMLQANTMRMNELAASIALGAQDQLAQGDGQVVNVPLGAAFGIPLLAGAGPKMEVRIVPVGAVSTRFITEFESAGINQTRHKIYLLLQATVALVLPGNSQQVEVGAQVPIAESIIVGTVPDSFVDVNNTDDLLNLLP